MIADIILEKGGQLIDKTTGEIFNFKARPLIYISGPMFTEGNFAYNLKDSACCANYAYSRGWAPVVPQYNYIESVVFSPDEEKMLNIDLSILYRCDAVMVRRYNIEVKNNLKPSGTALELSYAESLDKPIYTWESIPLIEMVIELKSTTSQG